VVCHGDFHPMNVLVAEDGSMGVIDWTDACIADRHHDVGRTTSLYGLAYLLAGSPVERVALRVLRKRLVAWHLKSYEATARVMVDRQRLAWWQAVHAFRGWLQLSELAEGAVENRNSSTVAAIPDSVRQTLLAQCVSLRRLSGY
jgi:aminoglycoside phosphotransferase (APT) family kinase protein